MTIQLTKRVGPGSADVDRAELAGRIVAAAERLGVYQRLVEIGVMAPAMAEDLLGGPLLGSLPSH
jgi:hypothetical protein